MLLSKIGDKVSKYLDEQIVTEIQFFLMVWKLKYRKLSYFQIYNYYDCLFLFYMVFSLECKSVI